SHHSGLAGIFYLTTFLAVAGIFLLHLVIPTPQKECFHADSEANISLFKPVITNRHLQRLNVGIFCQHFILTSTFFAIPLLLAQHVKLGHLTQQWHFYLPLMLFSFVVMIPFIIMAEKKKRMKSVFVSSVLFSACAQFLLAFASQNWYGLCTLMFVYFIAFNILEATLPSLISKQANPQSKGTAMGVYSTSQFLGIFVGGALAGILYQWHSSQGIFLINALLGFIWLAIAVFMQPNVYVSTLILHYSPRSEEQNTIINALLAVKGINEVALSEEEQVIYIRINRDKYVPGSAEQILSPHSESV
ncbi:MFS transporter, partial [uncultured Legionella sp.]|uniref:MFS transporter n=1 Tax=uncultured Legionella sp. TaxID=210934 RepID=UPI00260469F9